MLLEVNSVKVVIALRPEATPANLAAFRSIALDAKPSEKIIIIAEPHEHAKWSPIIGPRLLVHRWKSSAVSAVFGNVRSALDTVDRHPHMAACVCFDADDVREAILTRCGVIQIDNGLSRDAIPDVFLSSIDALKSVLARGDQSFLGEHRATTLSAGRFPRGRGRFYRAKGLLASNPKIDFSIASRIDVMFLGRYFSSRDQRREKHQFSKRLYNFKRAGPGSALIASVLGEGLSMIEDSFDVLTRIPPKPGEDDRVGGQLKTAVDVAISEHGSDLSAHKRVRLESLSAARAWETQKGLSFGGRAANVRDAFTAKNVRGKKVLVFDDIVTSGASIIEAGRALFAAGANEVHALVIGLNQNIVLKDVDEGLPCPSCQNGSLQIRFRSDNGLAFWGCADFYTNGCKGSMKWDEGLSAFNKETRRQNIIEIPDIDF